MAVLVVLYITGCLDLRARGCESLGLLHSREHVVPAPRSCANIVLRRDHAGPKIYFNLGWSDEVQSVNCS